jgi:hypothetical protein
MRLLLHSGLTNTDKENKMVAGRTSAGINKSGGSNVNPVYKAVSTLTSYVGNVARELRDIPTAIGAPKRMESGTKKVSYVQGDTGKKETFTAKKYKGNAPSGIGAQIKEAAAALTAGQKGTSVGHISASGKVKPRRSR